MSVAVLLPRARKNIGIISTDFTLIMPIELPKANHDYHMHIYTKILRGVTVFS